MPGVVVLERVLEAIEQVHGRLGGLRMPQVKFARPLLPGELAKVELDGSATGRWRFRVMRGDALIASGEIVATAADCTAEPSGAA